MSSSWTAGVMVGKASAYWLIAQSPALAAKVQGGVLVSVMETLPPAEVMTAVRPAG